MPKVSVLIPAYNAMAYLPETLDNVLKQTFKDFEVLIINDGSSDNIVEWASTITDPRVKLISQANQGVSIARNTAVMNARGEYVAFVDADDLWKPTKLEQQIHCLDDNPEVALVHTWMLLIDEEGKSTGRVMKSTLEGDALQKIIERNSIACSSVMIRRSCFENVGIFDCNLKSIEDWDMWIRIALHYPLALIKEPLTYHRKLGNSLSKNWLVMEKDFGQVIEKTFKCVPPELLYLKNHSYGYANLCLAWKAVQSSHRDYKTAIKYRGQALKYYPRLCLSKDCIRLSLAIALMNCFKGEQYTKVMDLTYTIRRYVLSFLRRT